ncbi:hypothetical protein BC941DRAFT_439409 [Chlamydoabsidia padenii]|nr:hypothetical protein BC941DRAFT_439409 [Chlamydoabsidia padenii]
MKMLMKMGFKQGTGLGKDGQEGRQEPITVELKHNRGGIGIDTARKRKQAEEEQEEMERRKKLDMDPALYREHMAEKAKEGKRIRQITAAAHLCEKKDTEKEIDHNILWTLAPKTPKDVEHEEQEEPVEQEDDDSASLYNKDEVEKLKSLPLDEQLGKLVDYLRDRYQYCFWCGAQFEDKADLDANCPGIAEDDH